LGIIYIYNYIYIILYNTSSHFKTHGKSIERKNRLARDYAGNPMHHGRGQSGATTSRSDFGRPLNA
jgi:hypothetical protein